MKNKCVILAVLAASFCSASVIAAAQGKNVNAMISSASTTEFSPQQQQAIEKITHNYLVQHPEVLMEAAQALQAKQAKQMQSQALKAIVQNTQQLFKETQSPVAGAKNGDAVLVEFFDYQCGHCKAMEPIISELLKKDANVKIIYKELPIFGESSEYAAKAALAAVKQNKFAEFHEALFKADKALNAETVMAIAKSVGLNTTQLAADMKDPAIEQQIKANLELAQALRLVGTPSFVLANKNLTQYDFIPGATTQEDLQARIDKLMKNKSSE